MSASSIAPQSGIFWLASYPKSGNTWTRAFIANLMHEEADAVDINALETGSIASGRQWVANALGFEISDLSQDEVDRLRPAAYRWLATQPAEKKHHKIHDAFTYLPDGTPLIPVDATRGALYIVRNPLDVAVSLAHHNGCSIDKAIASMGKADYSFCGKPRRLHNQLRQKLLTWSEHVNSWLDASGLNRLLVRYEDMKSDPLAHFTEMATFLELPSDEAAVTAALECCKMEKLQKQESEHGFGEKSPRAKSFFRKGIVGDWEDVLTEEQISQILNDHHEVMQQLGYLDAEGSPSAHIRNNQPALDSRAS